MISGTMLAKTYPPTFTTFNPHFQQPATSRSAAAGRRAAAAHHPHSGIASQLPARHAPGAPATSTAAVLGGEASARGKAQSARHSCPSPLTVTASVEVSSSQRLLGAQQPEEEQQQPTTRARALRRNGSLVVTGVLASQVVRFQPRRRCHIPGPSSRLG